MPYVSIVEARYDDVNMLADLTRGYQNLLGIQKEESGQRFYYDGNVAAMEETSGRIAGGRKSVGRTALHGLHYYMRDELGSPLRVSRFGAEVNSSMSRNRYLTYGYDEFGNDLGNDLGRELKEAGIPNVYDRQEAEQPFGYTGYRYDKISRTYFAQAREYQPENGRFTAEDVVKGNNATLVTLNQYSYCWNNPKVFADHDGRYPIYTAIGEGIGNTITSLGEAVGNAVGEIGTALGNAAEEIYSAVGTSVQDICGTVGDATQEIGAIMGNSPSAQLSGALVNHAGNYVGNEIRIFGVETGNFIKTTGVYAENNIKSMAYAVSEETKSLIKDENIYGTVTYGGNVSGTLGIFTIDGSIGLSMDYKGNIAIQATGAWGVTASSSPSIAGSFYRTITNAPDIDALLKDGGCIGGSVIAPFYGIPVYIGADLVIVGDLNNKPNECYYGCTTALGSGYPNPSGEVHVEMTYTKPVTKTFNIFDFLFDTMDVDNCIE